MGRVEGKVALITGAARGQGRSHALRLAEEGADIIAVDICRQIDTVPFPMATPEDLEQTVKGVEALGRRIVSAVVDVRDYDELKSAVDAGVAELGRLDLVCANAGIGTFGSVEELTAQAWKDVVDIDMSAVWHTAKVSAPHIRAGGEGGSIVITSSGAGMKGSANLSHYVAAKTGVIGLMRALAVEFSPDQIRVNAIAPSTVNTAMIHNDAMYQLFRPDLEKPGLDDVIDLYKNMHLLPVPWMEPSDISNAVLFLLSDEARYITGVTLPVDAGFLLK